jgi:hypothetical protein
LHACRSTLEDPHPDPSLQLSYNTTVYVNFNYPIELNKNLIKVFQNNQLFTNYQVKSLENSLQFDFKNLQVDADIKIQLSKDLLIKKQIYLMVKILY